MPRNVRIQTGEGERLVPEAEYVGVPGITLTKCPGDPKTYAITHVPTGMCFFASVPGLELARQLAKAIGGMANWNYSDVEDVHAIFRSLPRELRRWMVDGQRAWSEWWKRPPEPAKRKKACKTTRRKKR
jgi:hypothetical protein